MSKLQEVAEELDLEVFGVLGRPIYVCTARPYAENPKRLCMSTACMSPYIQLSAARKHYLCAKCKKELNTSKIQQL